MWHLPLAWVWVVVGAWAVAGRPPLPAALAWLLVILSIAGWRQARRSWPALLQPGRVARSLCWLGHALTASAGLLVLALFTPLAGDRAVFGVGLLIGGLLAPLPCLGLAAWSWHLLDTWRGLRSQAPGFRAGR